MNLKQSPRVYVEKTLQTGSYEHFSLLLLHIGSLAPSTHNTQPWLLDYTKESIIIWPDYEKQVPHADPHNKYLFISLGAFVGNVIDFLQACIPKTKLAVSYDTKTQATTVSFTQPERKELTAQAKQSLERILHRQNYRGFYSPPKKRDITSMKELVSSVDGLLFTTEPKDIEQLASLTAEGVETAYSNREFRQEISALINHNRSKKRVGLHGYSLRLKQVQSLIVPQVMRYKDIGKKLGGLNKKSFDTSHGVCLFVLPTAKDNTQGWIDVGMKMEDLQLRLQDKGYVCSIYVASLEQEKTLKRVKEIFGVKTKKPAILFTVGKAPDRLPHSVRQHVSEKMKS